MSNTYCTRVIDRRLFGGHVGEDRLVDRRLGVPRGVDLRLLRDHPMLLAQNGERCLRLRAVRPPEAVLPDHRPLLTVPAHEIEVQLLRHAQRIVLQAIGGVVGDIEVTRETIALRVVRHIEQVDARYAIHHQRIEDIIAIERGRQGRGERRDEAVGEQVRMVGVDIDVAEEGVGHLPKRTRT